MSHIATSWAVSIRGLTSGEFRVLLVLADCHNPSRGCFPSQSYLREACEMSNGALNSNLGKLAEKGLVERERRGNSATGGRASTRYILGFEKGLTPESGDKVNSGEPETRGGLTPESGVVNSGGPEIEPVREPVKRKEPVSKSGVSEALEVWASPEAVASFIAYRRGHKSKALTLTAAKRLANNLQEIFNAGFDPSDALGLAEERGWASVQPDWYFNAKGVHRDNRPNRSQPAQRPENRPDPALEQIARLAGLSEAQGHGGG